MAEIIGKISSYDVRLTAEEVELIRKVLGTQKSVDYSNLQVSHDLGLDLYSFFGAISQDGDE